MFDKSTMIKTGVVCLALLALAACRPDEQGRPLHYEPGVYPGDKNSSPLTEDQLAGLRQRALEQGDIPAGGGATPSVTSTTGEDVRPPVPGGAAQ